MIVAYVTDPFSKALGLSRFSIWPILDQRYPLKY